MSRRIICLITAFFLVLPALRAGLIQDEVGGPDWLKYGANIRVRQVGFNNIITWDNDAKVDQQNFFRIRSRIYGGVDPTEDISAYVRFVNEWRYYIKHYSAAEGKWDNDSYSHPLRHEVIMDNAWAH